MPNDPIVPISTFRILPVSSIWPGVYGATSPQGSWGGTTANTADQCVLLGGYKAGGLGPTAPPYFKNISGAVSPICYARAQSEDLLYAQVISGNVTFTLMAQESNALANNFLRVYMWVKQAGTASTVRGVLLDYTDAASEFPTTAAGITTGPVALTPVTAHDGDVLIVEIGTANTVFAGYNAKIWLSGGCLSTGVFVGDMTVGSTDATLASTIVFDSPISVHQPTPTTGDVLGGNTRLFLYDGTTGALKREVMPPGAAAISGGATQADGTILFAADTGFAYAPSWLWRFNQDLSFNEFVSIGSAGINPHSITRDVAGNNYIGYVGDNGTGCGEDGDIGPPAVPSFYVRRLNAAGTLDTTYPILPDLGGSQAVDLAADQVTLVYTSLGREIKRYNVGTSTQLSDWTTLPTETNAVARGLVLLPDGGAIVADMVNLKRLDASGAVIQTYTLPSSAPPIFLGTFPSLYSDYYATFTGTYSSQGDWGVVALSPDGSEFWAANRSDYADELYGSVGKWNVETGELLILITQGYIVSTGGGFCSGGLVVYNGCRVAISEPNPEPTYPSWLNSRVRRYPRRLRRTPHVSDTGQRIRMKLFQLDIQAGMVQPDDPDAPRDVIFRKSDDGGHTWSNERALSAGALGEYKKRLQWWQCGADRDSVIEITDSLPNPFIQAWVLLEPYDH